MKKTILITLSVFAMTFSFAQTSNCTPMEHQEFNDLCVVMKGKASEEAKLKKAKKTVGSSCITSQQASTLMAYFQDEGAKLDFAMYAYDYCSEQDTYVQMVDKYLNDESKTALYEELGISK